MMKIASIATEENLPNIKIQWNRQIERIYSTQEQIKKTWLKQRCIIAMFLDFKDKDKKLMDTQAKTPNHQ